MSTVVGTDDAAAMGRFLDRLMLAESAGRDDARNPRSTAVGPFQFIESTFLEVARRHFAAETAGLAPAQILVQRTNRPFARRAAEAFTLDNAALLSKNGITTSFANLRLAFLVGPSAAVRLLKADATTPVISILGSAVVQANPFMAGMASRDLVAWSERNLAAADGRIQPRPGGDIAGLIPGEPSRRPAQPVITAQCNLALASCRKWLVLAQRTAARPTATRVGLRRTGPTTR